ncbi:hypothetical protein [Facklamia miroungae]|uniref:hypothetical protein n=1 Tax=Facklamia miroungae TaxID=120956 RepID=UPI001FE06E32|nr:hypothetical protein [Facklamia miroungae]
MKKLLKDKNISGFSKLKKEELLKAVRQEYSETELAILTKTRGYHLTPKGEQALKNNQAIVDKHPKKPGF